jgi:hypothetical protein
MDIGQRARNNKKGSLLLLKVTEIDIERTDNKGQKGLSLLCFKKITTFRK